MFGIGVYLHMWMKHNALHYRTIPYGFDHFSDGIVVETWMHHEYNRMLTPVIERDDGTIIQSRDDNIYTRILFQQRVLKNPFLVDLSNAESLSGTIPFMEWLLRGPSSQAVDMEGIFYRSDVESKAAEYNHSITERLHQKVLSQRAHHHANHGLYHMNVSSSSSFGVNVIGW